MIEVYLKFSQAHENSGRHPFEGYLPEYLEREHLGHWKKHVVLYNVVDGSIHRAHLVARKKRARLIAPDEVVEGPFDKNKLIYFEYKTGPAAASEIESQISQMDLSQEEADRIRQAYAKQYVSRPGVGVHSAQKLKNV